VQKIHRGSGVIDTTAYPSVVRERKVRKGCKAGNDGHGVYVDFYDRSSLRSEDTSSLPLLDGERKESAEGGPIEVPRKNRGCFGRDPESYPFRAKEKKNDA